MSLHVRRWDGGPPAFVLVHGLASNCLTWEPLARRLHAHDHAVVAIDQRGHGLSEKPDEGYDFATVVGDLRALIDGLAFAEPPIVAGQSWGGNVALELAARYPGAVRGLVLVDGGYIDLSARPGATWEQVSVELRPPPLAGTPRAALVARLRAAHPDWTDEGIANTLGNFEALPDATVRPWLTLERHMRILRALWEQHPSELYPRVSAPTLIVAAEPSQSAHPEWKLEAVRRAGAAISRCRVHWLANTAHDVHVHRPDALAELIVGALRDGFFEPAPAGAADR